MPMTEPRIRFENPPVVEVVFGVQFKSEQPLTTTHFGLYWDRFLQKEFPNVTDQPPLSPVIEAVGSKLNFQLEFGDMPPLRRVWFATPDGHRLLQLQEDRFHYNWKRSEQAEPYPGYDSIVPEFQQRFSEFQRFMSDAGLGRLQLSQFELTYVNHIDRSGENEDVIDYGSLLVDHFCAERTDRFLPPAEIINWATSYPLPRSEGRLHINARTATRAADERRILRLDLTVRGIPSSNPSENMMGWLGAAHEWITRGFADSISDDLQKAWGRIS